MKKIAHIFTDGSCHKNPGPAGYGIVILENGYPKKISGYIGEGTNQRAELFAIIEAMRQFKEKYELHLYTDSAYVSNCYNKRWYGGWLRNGWKNSAGEPVANKDLWEEFIELINFHDVVIHKVAGHAGDPLNEECDRIANEIISFLKVSNRYKF